MSLDPINFQSEKLKRSVEANQKLIEATIMATVRANIELGEICVFMSKELERIQREVDEPFSTIAAQAVTSAKQRMMQVTDRYKLAIDSVKL